MQYEFPSTSATIYWSIMKGPRQSEKGTVTIGQAYDQGDEERRGKCNNDGSWSFRGVARPFAF